jgi:hypothetical protein
MLHELAGEEEQQGGSITTVVQASGFGAYDYRGGKFLRVRLYGPGGALLAAQRALERQVSPVVAGLLVHGSGTNGYEWDGRVIPNEVALVAPTLNIYPAPMTFPDEDGGSTPAGVINTPDTDDPRGFHNAVKLTVTAQNQQRAAINVADDVLPTNDYRLALWAKWISGNVNYRLGGVSASKLDVAVTPEWKPYTIALPGFANTVNLGFSSAPGNSDGVVAVANVQLHDPLGGTVLPDMASELAALCFHAKRPAAYPGSIVLDDFGAVDLTADTDALVLMGPPDGVTLDAYGMGVWLYCDSEPTSTAGIGFGSDFHPEGTTGPLHGQLGVVANSGQVDRAGMPYFNPGLSLTVAKTGHYLVGQGLHHLSISVDHGVVTFYVNAVPLTTGNAAGWTPATFRRLLLGGYAGVNRLRKTGQHLPGGVQGWYLRQGAMSDDDMLAMDLHWLERFAVIGDDRVGARDMLFIGDNDSRTAFSGTPFWHLTQHRGLSPRLHAMLEAVGGTNLTNWMADPRKAFHKRQIRSGGLAGYKRIFLLQQPGTNELLHWFRGDYTGPAGTGGLPVWLTDYKSYQNELRGEAPGKVWITGMTLLPCPTTFGAAYSVNDLACEQIRYTFNDMAVANPADVGWDHTIDTGRGTERLDAAGAVVAEPIGGGDLIGNYRFAAAHITTTRSPAVQLDLSALSGATFTATTNPPTPGTFTSQDVGHGILAGGGGTGRADIIAISPDGSSATVSTTGFTPVPYAGEPAASIARDTVTRPAFNALSYAAGNWSVVDAALMFLGDGLHYGESLGRKVCDERLAPYIQAYQAAL